MAKIHFFQSLFLFLTTIIVLPSSNLSAQNNRNTQANNGLSMSYSAEIGGFYFQDASGLQIALNGIPYEGIIDKNNYRLGSNDLIAVEIKSLQGGLFRGLIVNSSGEIVIPSVGIVMVNDQTMTEAEKSIQEIVREIYKSATVNISLEFPKSVNVYVTGNIPFPGKLVLPAQSRIDLAILQAIKKIEKPEQQVAPAIDLKKYTNDLLKEKIYSFRNVEIHHSDGSKSSADLIRYYRAGHLQSNPIVRNGDRITLTKMNFETPTVSISGAVQNGYELEYRKGDTPNILLEIANGFTEKADSSRIFVFRNINGNIEKIEISPSQWDSFTLNPYDRLVIPTNNVSNINASAWITGEVKTPGNFPIISGKTSVYTLLEYSDGFTDNALQNAAYLYRGEKLENEIPNKFDSLLIQRTSNQLIQGLDYLALELNLSKNKVALDLNNEEELRLLKVFDGDSLFIPRDEQTVFVFGQVNNPGYFSYRPSELNALDYINKAGSFALSADKSRIFVIKAGNSTWYKPEETTIESGDRVFVDRVPIEDLNQFRTYEVQRAQQRIQRTQLILTAITTITGIITTYVAVRRL